MQRVFSEAGTNIFFRIISGRFVDGLLGSILLYSTSPNNNNNNNNNNKGIRDLPEFLFAWEQSAKEEKFQNTLIWFRFEPCIN
jgi:hypothetical protein